MECWDGDLNTYGKLAKNAQNSGYYNDRLADSYTSKPKDERQKNNVRVFSNSSNRSSRGGRNNNYRRSNYDSSQMEIDSNFVGRVIGRGGSKIQAFQDESGARIKVLNESDANGSTVICLTGSAEARDIAKILIEEFIADFSQVSIDKSSKSSNGAANNTNNKAYDNEPIEWNLSNQEYEEARKKKLAALPEIKKYFYVEHPAVAAMTKTDVVQLRALMDNISVCNVDLDDDKSIPNPITTFEEAFQPYSELLEELKNQGFSSPSPIQCQAWPIIMSGLDMIGISQTGTGKTIAFLFPALIHIIGQVTPREQRKGPSCVILAPTREIVIQIEEEAKKYSYHNIRSTCVYGGTSRREQINVVTEGVDIIIATPGRLNDLVMNHFVDLTSVTYLVLDEADSMLDLGFEPQIQKIVLDIHPDRQTIMTSATWNLEIQKMAAHYLTKPIKVNVGALSLFAIHSVTQEILFVDDEDERHYLLNYFVNSLTENDKAIIFVDRKCVVDDVSTDLIISGIDCQSIHGEREQSDREQALNDLKTGAVNILVATDVASRGLDIKDITHIFNMYFPRNIEEYVHRIGQTGRAGRTGTAISIFTKEDASNAEALIEILREADEYVPDELKAMAAKFKERRCQKLAKGALTGGGRHFRGRGHKRF
ncbi:UNVERIFIED_CONTAM: ATP-dependent RNA helicase DDX43 [Trichonephila clavipes]